MSPETKRPRLTTSSRSITPNIKTSKTPDAVFEWLDGREISRLDEGMTKASFSASQQGYPLKDAFILDSGSTTHICNNLSRLEDVRPPVIGDYIWAGNSRVWIEGYGDVNVTAERSQGKQTLHLSNVAWCPDFLCSLVSFRLLRGQGIWWDNREDPTSLRRWDGSTIAILSERYGQWAIKQTTIFASAFHVRMNRAKRSPQKATAILWHKRLGHPRPSAVEHLVQQSEGVKIKGITTVQCDACGRSKSKRQIRRALRLNDEVWGENCYWLPWIWSGQLHKRKESNADHLSILPIRLEFLL